jgi:hypothetical protein
MNDVKVPQFLPPMNFVRSWYFGYGYMDVALRGRLEELPEATPVSGTLLLEA